MAAFKPKPGREMDYTRYFRRLQNVGAVPGAIVRTKGGYRRILSVDDTYVYWERPLERPGVPEVGATTARTFVDHMETRYNALVCKDPIDYLL